jgi:hypothetical protein
MADAVIYQKGPIHLSDVANKYKWEPQRTNHFEVVITGLPKELTLAVNTFSLPNVTNDPIEVPHGNSRIKFAGQTMFGGSDSLEVIDYVGLDTEKIVNDWRLQVYDPQTDQMGVAVDYKKNATITEYAPDHTQLRVWNLEGVWCSGAAFGDSLTMDGSDVKKITMTLAYDRGYRKSSGGATNKAT